MTSAGDEIDRENTGSRGRIESAGNLYLHEDEEFTAASFVVSAAGARHSQEHDTSAGAGVDADFTSLESSARDEARGERCDPCRVEDSSGSAESPHSARTPSTRAGVPQEQGAARVHPRPLLHSERSSASGGRGE